MHPLEILATILIIFVIVSIIIFLINPKGNKKLSKKICSNSQIIKLLAFVLALMVLYLLIDSGLTVVDILAIALFFGLVIILGIADYMGEFNKKVKIKELLRNEILYILIWLFLIIWGIKVIFF